MFNRIILFGFGLLFLIFSVFIIFSYKIIKSSCGRCKKVSYNERRLKYKKNLSENHNTKSVVFKAEDGINISGLLIENDFSKNVLMICHGYWQSKEFMHQLVDIFSKDFSIFIFDFRSHGESDGDFISLGLNESKDVLAALEFLKINESTKNKPVYALGLSMGCSALSQAIFQGAKFKGLIFDSCFSKLDGSLCSKFSNYPSFSKWTQAFLRYIFEFVIGGKIDQINPINFVENISVPTLIIHSKSDDKVSVDDAYKIYSKLKCTKDLWVVDGPFHCDIYKEMPDQYRSKILNFLKSNQ